MKRLWQLPGVRGLALRCAVLAALVGGLVLAQWSLVARFVNGVFREGERPVNLLSTLGALAAVWLVRGALTGVRDFLAARAAAGLKRDLRVRLFGALLDLGPGFVAGERGGELTELVQGGVDKFEAFAARFVPLAVFAGIVPPVLALGVLWLDPLSGLILLFTGPLVALLLWLVGTLADEAAREQWLALGRLGAGFVDTLRGLSTLVVFGRAGRRLEELGTLNDAYRHTTLRVLRAAFLSGAVLELGATLSTALVAVTVGVRLFEGELPFGRALLALLLTPEFFAPLRALGGDHHASLEARAVAGRVFAVLETPTPSTGTLSVPAGLLRIELRGVKVNYGPRAALDGVSLHLPPGETLTLVGESGAGKTSLARVLLGFAVPHAGEVRVNGVLLSDLDLQAWRAQVAYLPERPYLFPGTVWENLTLGQPHASREAVLAAARAARAEDFIRCLPQGYDTPVGEGGVKLSGGERARLALARAFLKDASLLILDEPTAQLDAHTERELRGALDELCVGRTTLLITHRAALQAGRGAALHLHGGRVVTPLDLPALVEGA